MLHAHLIIHQLILDTNDITFKLFSQFIIDYNILKY